MTEQASEETPKDPYDFRDPSEAVREIVSGDEAPSPGSDPGDESDHEEKNQTRPEETPKPSVEEPSVGMKSLGDYLDEDLAGVVSSLVKKIDRLESEKRDASNAAKVDDLVNSLGEDWQPVFRDKENRAKLSTAIQVIKTGYERSNVPVPDEQEIVEKALRAEFGDVKQTIEQEATEAKVEARKSQMISRASGRRTDSLSPKESALREVHKIMAQRGLYNQ